MGDRVPRAFGADDHLVCPRCGNTMGLTRRSPHDEFGETFERQVFTCYTCHHETERSSDSGGHPHE